jgi:hypothetical protein
MRVGRYSDMVDHEVRGVVEAEGKESGRCSNGGDVGLITGSFCSAKDPSAENPTPGGKRGLNEKEKQLRNYEGNDASVFCQSKLYSSCAAIFDCWKE